MIVRPPQGSLEWLYTNIHPLEDVQFQKEMKQYNYDNPNWVVGSATLALEKAPHNRLVCYINYKLECIAHQKLSTIQEEQLMKEYVKGRQVQQLLHSEQLLEF